MAISASFSLESTESSPWVVRLGRGVLRASVSGTWAGTVTPKRLAPDGSTELDVRDMNGTLAAFTSNTGVFELDDLGPYRFAFARDSGTAVITIWSDESQIGFPYGYELQDGDIIVMEDGDYLQMENG